MFENQIFFQTKISPPRFFNANPFFTFFFFFSRIDSLATCLRAGGDIIKKEEKASYLIRGNPPSKEKFEFRATIRNRFNRGSTIRARSENSAASFSYIL